MMGKFMFNLKATDGQVVLTSELYKQKFCAEKGIESVRKNAAREGAFETKVNFKGGMLIGIEFDPPHNNSPP